MSGKKLNDHTMEQWLVRVALTMLAWKCLGPEMATMIGLPPVPAVMAYSTTPTPPPPTPGS